jgi:hypothetical protein
MAKQSEVKIGDKIKVTNPSLITSGEYGEGSVLTVSTVGEDRVYVEEFRSPFIFFYEFEVITEAAPKQEPEEGDLIVFHEDELDTTAGKPYVIIDVDSDGYVLYRDDEDDLVHADDSEYTLFKRVGPKPEQVPAKPEYAPNEGDIVRITEDNPNGSRHLTGDIGEVTRLGSSRFWVDTHRKEGPGCWVEPKYVELIVKAENREDVTNG